MNVSRPPLTPIQLDADERLCATATEGPWQRHPIDGYAVHQPVFECWIPQNKDDAEFIARARTALPAYIAHIRELEAQIAYMKCAADKRSKPRAQSGGDVEAALRRIGIRLTKSYLGQEVGFPMIDAMRRDEEDLKTFRAALTGGWRTIESAPKDGAHFLGWHELYYANRPVIGHWDGGKFNFSGRVEPTHWQPLPTPPADGEER